MSILKEFKEFAVKGNVVDLAVGVIIGAAFGKIVSSLVADVLMPPLGLALGGINFSHMKVVLKEAEEATAAVTLNYGTFLQTVFDFLLVAIAIFGVVKLMNRLKRTPPPAEGPPPPPEPQIALLMDIRDLLKKRV